MLAAGAPRVRPKESLASSGKKFHEGSSTVSFEDYRICISFWEVYMQKIVSLGSTAKTHAITIHMATGWSGYLTSAGVFTHRAASTLGYPVQKHALE